MNIEKIEKQKCRKCGEVKELKDFYKHVRYKSGHRTECKKCSDNYNTEYLKNNRDRKLRYSRNNYKRNKETWENYRDKTRYGGNKTRVFERDNNKCCDCGSVRGLTIHHKDGKNIFNSNEVNNEMDNLVTLCRSCHQRFHRNSRNPYGGIKC